MSIFDTDICWIKATSFACLTALSLNDLVIARRCPRNKIAPAVISQRAEKPSPIDPTEDRAYWTAEYGRDLTEVEHLEIRTNLGQFAKVLMEQVQVMESDPHSRALLHEFMTNAGGVQPWN